MLRSELHHDSRVLARRTPVEVADYLRSVGDTDLAETLANSLSNRQHGESTFGVDWWPFHGYQPPPWLHAAHAFGYLPLGQPGDQPQSIRYAGNIASDRSLRGARITIKLDRLCVRSYPGGGTHRVLLDFNARNQLPGRTEDVHFSATFRVPEGEHAGVVGHPIFVGLNVGAEGIAFGCQTINVKNDEDETFLGFLESDVFRSGLRLATTSQPALEPLSQFAVGITKAIGRRHRNIPVQEFYLGLDFGATSTGARLAEGSYLAVQIPESLQTVWDWNEWVYRPANGQVTHRDDVTKMIPYNYLVFSVTRFAK